MVTQEDELPPPDAGEGEEGEHDELEKAHVQAQYEQQQQQQQQQQAQQQAQQQEEEQQQRQGQQEQQEQQQQGEGDTHPNAQQEGAGAGEEAERELKGMDLDSYTNGMQVEGSQAGGDAGLDGVNPDPNGGEGSAYSTRFRTSSKGDTGFEGGFEGGRDQLESRDSGERDEYGRELGEDGMMGGGGQQQELGGGEEGDEEGGGAEQEDEEEEEEGGEEGAEDDEDEEDDLDELPIFANDQSRALHAEIKKRENRVEEIEELVVEHTDRVRVMEEHLRNVHQEVELTNSLMEAKEKERRTERHMAQLAARESGRYLQEVKAFDREGEDMQDKFNIAQNAIFKANEKMDQFKLQMNWNQEELEQWALAAKQKDDDNLQLQKYTRADEVKSKELTLMIEKLSKAAVEKKALLHSTTASAASRQVELDRAAEEFRQMHAARQDLVVKWQENIETMRQRDREINDIGTQYAAARKHRLQRHELLQQNVERLKMQEDDNQEVKSKIEQLERIVANRREENLRAQLQLADFKDELEVLKSNLSSSASALVAKRARKEMLEEQVEGKKKALDVARNRYTAAKERVANETIKTMTAEEAAKTATDDLRNAELSLKTCEKQLAHSKDTMFKESQKLYAFRQEEANLINEISSSQSAIRNLQGRVHQLDLTQIKQMEQIYTSEFKIQQMERKVARGLGERSDEEKTKLNQRIQELEGIVEQAREQKRVLVSQTRKLNNELRAAIRSRDLSIKQQSELEESINEIRLECAAEETSLKKVMRRKEEQMVNKDVRRLEIKRLRDILNGRTDEVYSLENRQEQLAMSMAERKSEIEVHTNVQTAMLRAAEEERHNVSLELGQRKQQVIKLRAKYETLAKTSSSDGGGGGNSEDQQHTQAYLIIKAAQRREELQREGDELDHSIRKCEREMKALGATLQHLNARNVDYRMSFNKADPNSEEADLLKHLEQQAKMAQDALFRKKKELQRLQTDFEEDASRLDSVMERSARLEEQNEQLLNAHDQVEHDLVAQEELLRKATAKLEKVRAEHRGAPAPAADGGGASSVAGGSGSNGSNGSPGSQGGGGGAGGTPTVTEKKLRAEAMNETVGNALYTLGQLAKEFPEIQDTLTVGLQKVGLSVPSKPPLRGGGGGSSLGRGGGGGGGSRLGSARSDHSSMSSQQSLLSTANGSAAGDRAEGGVAPMREFSPPF